MSIYQKTKEVIAQYPAYDVITLEPASNGFINLKDGDKLISGSRHTNKFMIGSVVASALKNGRDPIADYNRAVENGHATHFIFGLGSCITAHKRDKETYIYVDFGQHINFEGKVFEIAPAPNQNLRLIEVGERGTNETLMKTN